MSKIVNKQHKSDQRCVSSFADVGIELPLPHGEEVDTVCPHCGPQKRPSLSVNIRLGVWHCHRCDWSGSLKRGVSHSGRLLESLESGHDDDKGWEAEEAWRDLWERAERPHIDSPLWQYLDARGLSEVDRPRNVRFAKRLLYRGAFFPPAMLALVRDAEGQPVAVHRTYLSWDCKGKAPVETPRKLMPVARSGITRGAAIRLYRADDEVWVAESIENALAARLINKNRLPVWSCISAGGLAKFIPPKRIRKVIIAADNDDPGLKSADRLQHRLRMMGIKTSILAPDEPGWDWNDVIKREA